MPPLVRPSILTLSVTLILCSALSAGSIQLSQPGVFQADTLAVIPGGRQPTSLAFPGPTHVDYPGFLYVTARASGANSGLCYTLGEDGTLSPFGSASFDDLRLTFGEGVFGDVLYAADPSWPTSYTDGVYQVTSGGTPVLFSSLGGGNPDAGDILFGEGSPFAGFLYVASPNAGAGGTSYDYAISRLDPLGAFAGQLVYNASGPIYLALGGGPSFGEYIYYSVLSGGNIYRVAVDGTSSLFATVPTSSGVPLAFSRGGAFGSYLYTGGYPLPGSIQRVAPDGTVSEFATEVYVSDLAFDPSSGDLFVTDSGRGLVLRIRPAQATGLPDNPSADRPHLAARIVFPSTDVLTVQVDLELSDYLRIGIFDCTGRRVGDLSPGLTPAGSHTLQWAPTARAGRPASGVYLVNVATPAWSVTEKWVLIR